MTLPKFRILEDHLAAAQCLSGKDCQAEANCEKTLTYGSCTVLWTFHMFHDSRITLGAYGHDVLGCWPHESHTLRVTGVMPYDRSHTQPRVGFEQKTTGRKCLHRRTEVSERPCELVDLAIRRARERNKINLRITYSRMIGRVNARKERGFGARIQKTRPSLIFPTSRGGTRQDVGADEKSGADRDAPPSSSEGKAREI